MATPPPPLFKVISMGRGGTILIPQEPIWQMKRNRCGVDEEEGEDD